MGPFVSFSDMVFKDLCLRQSVSVVRIFCSPGGPGFAYPRLASTSRLSAKLS